MTLRETESKHPLKGKHGPHKWADLYWKDIDQTSTCLFIVIKDIETAASSGCTNRRPRAPNGHRVA